MDNGKDSFLSPFGRRVWGMYFVVFFIYMWVKKYIEMYVKLFKMWKCVFEPHNQTVPNFFGGGGFFFFYLILVKICWPHLPVIVGFQNLQTDTKWAFGSRPRLDILCFSLLFFFFFTDQHVVHCHGTMHQGICTVTHTLNSNFFIIFL